MQTPISVWIVIDTIRTFLKNFQKVSSIKWIVTELYTFVSLNSFFYFMRSIQISIWNEQENLNSVCANSVSKSLGLFASLPGHIMTSIVKIQLARLVALLTSFNRKSSKLQQDGYQLKTIRLRWLFMDALNSLPPLDKILSIVFLIHNDPQLITRWAHGTAVLQKMKEHCLSLESSLKLSLPFKNT